MNPIDRMLLDHANKIEIRTFGNPNVFEVVFSSLPSSEALDPLLSLINTERFAWSDWTKYELQSKKMLDLFRFVVECNNVIPASDAIAALDQMWRDAGYTVAIKGHPEQAQDEPQQTITQTHTIDNTIAPHPQPRGFTHFTHTNPCTEKTPHPHHVNTVDLK